MLYIIQTTFSVLFILNDSCVTIVKFSSDSLSEEPSMLSFGLFTAKLDRVLIRSGLDSRVEDLLDGETEYSDVLPSSEALLGSL